MPEDKPFPLPPREMRAQLGIPEDIDEGTIQDLFYGKPLPPPNLQEMFSPLQAGREALPTAVEAGSLVGGGILAGGGGIPGIIAAGGLNVFGRHLANKMRALNEGQILPDRANPATVSTDFILGASQAMVPVAKGPLGFVQQGLTQAGIGQAENLMEGKPLSMQQAGESALMGAGMHGTFQGVGKLAGKVLPLRTESTAPSPAEGQRAPLTTMLSGERGAALIGNLKPPTPDPMGFYSRLKHFADNLPDNAAHNPLALANQLQKGVTSKLELDETGVLPWLREQKGKVTSQQVRDYVDQHQIKVEEKMLGGVPKVSEETLQEHDDEVNGLLREARNWRDSGNEALAAHYFQLADQAEARFRELSRYQATETKWDRPETLTPFEHGAEPGSYRELVMTLPDTERNRAREIVDTMARDNEKGQQLQQQYGMTYGQALLKYDEKSKFISSHYSDIPNPLLHMRFDSRISPDGKKTLFLHEIQSDWHQQGREKGYQINPVTELPKGSIESIYKGATETSPYPIYQVQLPPGYTRPRENTFLGSSLEEARRNALRQINKGEIPNAPFKQTPEWIALGLKRLLRYAAENGYDRIAWTPGEAQAERYDLSKHIDAMRVIKRRSGDYYIAGRKDGSNILEQDVSENKLKETVGKDLADKIVGQPMGETREYTGIDLKLGGEGMKGFYGSPTENNLGIVGGVMNDLGKKWGARVGISEVPAERSRDVELITGTKYKTPDIKHKVHSLDLPDSLKKDVKEKGQPIASISDIFPMKERQA